MSKTSIIQIDELDWDAQFTVDIAQLDVPITNVGPGGYVAGAGKLGGRVENFTPGEHLILKSIGIRVPHLFVMGFENPTLFVRGITAATDAIIYGPIEIPYFNLEIEVNIDLNLEPFMNVPPVQMAIGLQLSGAGSASMLNVPAIIDSTDIPVLPFAKIEHNFPMIP